MATEAEKQTEVEVLTDDEAGPGLHGFDMSNCPTFYDHCNCTLETLQFNIKRAEEAEEKALRQLEEIGRLTTERDAARAEVKTMCGDIEALDPYLPPGWVRQPAPHWKTRWVKLPSPDKPKAPAIEAAVYGLDWKASVQHYTGDHSWEQGTAEGPLASMRKADDVLAGRCGSIKNSSV